MIIKPQKPTFLSKQIERRRKLSEYQLDSDRGRVDRAGINLLLPLFEDAKNKWLFDPNVGVEGNALSLNRVFNECMIGILPFYEYVGRYGVELGKQQLITMTSENYRVKASYDYEIEVNWALADEETLAWLRGGGSYSSPYFDTMTRIAANTNEHWLRRDYDRFINGEIDLNETRRHLIDLVFAPERADLIIRTNVTDIMALGQQQAYEVSGHTENTWFTRFDERVCPICAPLHGLSTRIGSPFAGTRITRPAAHGNCRCYLSPTPMSTDQLEQYLRNEGLLRGAVVKPKPKPAKKPAKKPVTKPAKKPVTKPINKPVVKPIETTTTPTVVEPIVKELTHEEKKTKFIDDLFSFEKKFLGDLNKKKDSLSKLNDEIDSLVTKSQNAVDEKERNSINGKLTTIMNKRDKLDNDVFNSERDYIAQLRKILYSVNGENIQKRTIDMVDGNKPELMWSSGLIYFNRMISDKYQTTNIVDVRKSTLLVAGRTTAYSFYTKFLGRGELNMSSNGTDATMVHELGHWLDHENKTLERLATEYLDFRTKGERAIPINTIPGYENSGFGDSEISKPDKFIRPYIGKIYPDRSTEVISMGLEFMYKDPIDFYRKDPHHFKFIYDVMTGRVLDNDYKFEDFTP